MWLMLHDDNCGVFLNAKGECPKCKFSPDTQLTAFQDISVSAIKAGLTLGKTYLGKFRVPIKDFKDLEASDQAVTDLDRARQIVFQAQEAMRTIHIEALQAIVGRNQNSSTRTDQSLEEQDWYDLRDLVKAIEEVQLRANSFRRQDTCSTP